MSFGQTNDDLTLICGTTFCDDTVELLFENNLEKNHMVKIIGRKIQLITSKCTVPCIDEPTNIAFANNGFVFYTTW